MIKIDIDNKTRDSIDVANVTDIVKGTLAKFDIKNALLEILFVGAEEISSLNTQYRQINHATDILSFPQISIAGQKSRNLGSLVICLEVVDEKRENLDDVIKHGLLHLLGFDHEVDECSWRKEATKINCNL